LNPQPVGPPDGKPVVLFADTFNMWFEPFNLTAAQDVFASAGYRVKVAVTANESRPLCCGRTYLTHGMIAEAKYEAERLVKALEPSLQKGVPIVGLEPSCLLGLRDEIPALLRTESARDLAEHSVLFEEFLLKENVTLPLKPINRV